MRKIFFTTSLLALTAGSVFADNVSVEAVQLAPGESQQISVSLNNTKQYSAFQFDVALPEGVTISKGDVDGLAVSLTDRKDNHLLKASKVGDNSYRLLAYSMDNATISGEEGALVNLTLSGDQSLAGEKTAKIDSPLFVEADGTTTQVEGTTFSIDAGHAFTLTPYSTNPNKRFTKWYGESPIAVKRSECKVYAGFMDGDFSLGLVQFKVDKNGLIHIPAKDAVLIITDKTELSYFEDDKPSTSWMGISDLYTDSQVLSTSRTNALKYCEDATTLETLYDQITDYGYYVYGWVKAGGFQKIVNGNTIPKGTLFAFAKEPAGGARMTVKWYDENGNLEAETTAIECVTTAAQAEGKSYNLNGQKVNAAYKGVIIKDGKKFIRK